MTDHYFSEMPDVEAQPRRITVRLAGRDVEVTTASGVFSPGRLDLGTQVLLRAVPAPPPGDLLDLGSGWGPIALQAGLEAQDAGVGVRIWALDVNRRSLGLTEENAHALGLDSIRPVTPDQVPENLEFDAIWSNPPIRVGKEVLHDLLTTWLPRLRRGGEAWLVVSKNLGADSLRKWIEETLGDAFTATKHSSAKGFRVILIRREA
ncbi:methyltransferase [Brevibacterium daeguense]|uniref:Methyltransferase n=1 Tax=Brevibacterium daeguense TaxID=909936 RepID=A0ABP8EMQ4_9MICO|nr:methyltransferase [Brevibacterium daeguense]